MITPPLKLDDTIVSDVDGLVTISSKSFETFLNKSRIDMFVDKPATIFFAFPTLFFGHGLLVFNALPLDLGNFMTDGLGVGVVFDRYKF